MKPGSWCEKPLWYFHDPAVGREMVVEGIWLRDPGAIRGGEDVAEPVGSGLVRPEEAEVLSVAGDDVAEEAAEHTCRLAERRRRLLDLDRVVAKVGQNEIMQQEAAVRVRVGAHPAIANRSQGGELGQQPALRVEELVGAVAAHPVLEPPELVCAFSDAGERHLV
jgi:hypothetical protein